MQAMAIVKSMPVEAADAVALASMSTCFGILDVSSTDSPRLASVCLRFMQERCLYGMPVSW